MNGDSLVWAKPSFETWHEEVTRVQCSEFPPLQHRWKLFLKIENKNLWKIKHKNVHEGMAYLRMIVFWLLLMREIVLAMDVKNSHVTQPWHISSTFVFLPLQLLFCQPEHQLQAKASVNTAQARVSLPPFGVEVIYDKGEMGNHPHATLHWQLTQSLLWERC